MARKKKEKNINMEQQPKDVSKDVISHIKFLINVLEEYKLDITLIEKRSSTPLKIQEKDYFIKQLDKIESSIKFAEWFASRISSIPSK